jgi:DNA polymerase-1
MTILSENKIFSGQVYDSSSITELLGFLTDQTLIAVSLRFSVASNFQREGLVVPNTSTPETELPRGLALDFLFLYRSEIDPEDSWEYIHIKNKAWFAENRLLLAPLLQFSVPYVGYNLGADLAWLNFLGLPMPAEIWDIRIAQRALSLGRINCKARSEGQKDLTRRIESQQQCQRQVQSSLELVSIASTYRIHCALNPIALICLEIYFKQRATAEGVQALAHLTSVEMPWAAVNTHMGYHGLRIDTAKQSQLLRHALADNAQLKDELHQMGVNSPHSPIELESFFRRHGFLDLFKNDFGQYSFSDDLLEAHQDKSPAIALIRRSRKISSICSTQLSVRDHLTDSGRIHPTHVQLGTETGRQTSHDPNVLGFDRIQRNLATPSEGYGIAEVDYSQQEVGIAAGLFQDHGLIRMYNAGDVYSRIAQQFFSGSPEIEEGSEDWGTERFRQVYPHLRERMKVVTLSVLYGQGAFGLAKRLGIEKGQAGTFLDNFFRMFPAVRRGMTVGVSESLRRGYVVTVDGLRIALDSDRSISHSVRQRMAKNYPVQASGAIVFKSAGVRLFEAYKPFQARLLVPMHDAFVFEAPMAHLAEVSQLTCEIMIAEMKRYFPQLEPRVNLNCARPDRWVKEGCENALEEYLTSAPQAETSLPLPPS